MNPPPADPARTARASDGVLTAICDSLFAAFPGQIQSIYLLGSRARHQEIPSSDVDLVAVFQGTIEPAIRTRVRQFATDANRNGRVMIDLRALDETELKSGLTPNVRQGELIAGPDVLKGIPLKSKRELVLIFAELSVHFIRVIRGRPNTITYPLEYPSRSGEFCGYEVHGTRVAENKYAPGLNTLVNLIVCIAMYRLAVLADFFSPDKATTAARYRELLPNDPQGAMVEELYRICRLQATGEIPASVADRKELARQCRQVLAFENEFLDELIMNLDRWILPGDARIAPKVFDFAEGITTASAPHLAKLNELKAYAKTNRPLRR